MADSNGASVPPGPYVASASDLWNDLGSIGTGNDWQAPSRNLTKTLEAYAAAEIREHEERLELEWCIQTLSGRIITHSSGGLPHTEATARDEVTAYEGGAAYSRRVTAWARDEGTVHE